MSNLIRVCFVFVVLVIVNFALPTSFNVDAGHASGDSTANIEQNFHTDLGDDNGNNPYFPKIGQECIKFNAPGWPDSDFWVQFRGSKHKYTCLDSSRDCFQKLVEDDE